MNKFQIFVFIAFFESVPIFMEIKFVHHICIHLSKYIPFSSGWQQTTRRRFLKPLEINRILYAGKYLFQEQFT